MNIRITASFMLAPYDTDHYNQAIYYRAVLLPQQQQLFISVQEVWGACNLVFILSIMASQNDSACMICWHCWCGRLASGMGKPGTAFLASIHWRFWFLVFTTFLVFALESKQSLSKSTRWLEIILADRNNHFTSTGWWSYIPHETVGLQNSA